MGNIDVNPARWPGRARARARVWVRAENLNSTSTPQATFLPHYI